MPETVHRTLMLQLSTEPPPSIKKAVRELILSPPNASKWIYIVNVRKYSE